MTDTTLIEPHMLRAHPYYVAAIVLVVAALFLGVRWINRKRGGET